MTRAALQRKLQVGVKLKLVWRSMDGPKDLPREVIQVQTNGVWMKGPDSPRMWLPLKDCRRILILETANGFELQWLQKNDGITAIENRIRYEWLAPVPQPQMTLADSLTGKAVNSL